MELLKLVRHPYNGGIVAHIYKGGCFTERLFIGYTIKQVFENLRACGCVCSNRLRKVERG